MLDDFERMLIFGRRERDEFFAGGCLIDFPEVRCTLSPTHCDEESGCVGRYFNGLRICKALQFPHSKGLSTEKTTLVLW